MESILRNQTIHSFLRNFERADQTHIIQDLIIIGIQTVLKNVKSNAPSSLDDSLEKSFNNQTIAQIQRIKQDVLGITKNLKKINPLVFTDPHLVRIVRHQPQHEGTHRVSPRHKEVTAKVTESYPQGRTMAPARSHQRFRHHLDDSQARQTFVQPPPLKNPYSRIPKPEEAMKPSKDKQNSPQRINRSHSLKKKQMSPQKSKRQENNVDLFKDSVVSRVNKQVSNQKKQQKQQKNPEIKRNTYQSSKKVQSKIKDLIDFDKKNSRLHNFHNQKQQPSDRNKLKSEEVMSFKKKKDQSKKIEKSSSISVSRSPSSSPRKNNSSGLNSESQESFSPYKKDKNENRLKDHQARQFQETRMQNCRIKPHKEYYQQPSEQRSDEQSQFSRYESNQIQAHHQQPSYTSYSGQSSSSSRMFANKAIGKITKKK